MPKKKKPAQTVKTVEVGTEREFKRYLKYLSHPGHIMWRNFLAGTFHGLGFVIGTAVILGFLGFILNDVLSNVPLFSDLADALDLWLAQNSS